MNERDRKFLKRIRIVLRGTDHRRAVIEADMILAEWQDIDRTGLPGHVDKVFNNFGSGSSDRGFSSDHPWWEYAELMKEMIKRYDL